MLRCWLLIVLVACSSKSEKPTRDAGQPLGFVPAQIANQLGDASLVIALDVGHSDVDGWLAKVPVDLGCARALVKSIGVLVVAGDAKISTLAAYASGLQERETRTCLDQLMPKFGATTGAGAGGAYEVKLPGASLSLVWHDGILVVHLLGFQPSAGGPPRPLFQDLVKQVPANARAFVVGTYSERKIKSLVGWFRLADDALLMTLRAEGTEHDVAQPWLQSFIDGFNRAVEAKGIAVDYRWFDGTLKEPVGTIEGRIPISVFEAAAR